MLCEKCCKNPATTHIKTAINGKFTELSLCGYCAAEAGYNSFAGSTFSGILASMLGQSLKSSSSVTARRCQCCGAAFADIAESGKVGCANCYNEFGEELLPYLKRIHGSVHHNGKNPGNNQLIIKDKSNTVSELKVKLANLVAAEKYEEAAVVRDEIKKLEGKE